MVWLVLVGIGLLAGSIGSLVGLGGGIIIVPSLLYLGASTNIIEELTPQIAVGVSTVIMIFTGLSSTLSYLKHKVVDYKAGLIFFIGSAPGGIIGAYVNKNLNVEAFSLYFGAFMIFMAIVLLVKNRLKPMVFKPGKAKIVKTYKTENGHSFSYGYHPLIAVSITFVVGFSSGLFGIGGGALMVPVMMLLFFFPPHMAVATSMFMVFLSSVTNSITHISLGNVNWPYAFALIPGAWFGAKLGAYINTRLKSGALENMLKIVLIIIGLRLIYQSITG
ncbi:sulfite exporter TauE/SafE family protein [Peribacillus simplex]|uniref:sulfite exporter TauE/SafE family protein n=1 Tax=Peribacillus TaxID=2675229 RepID=UPI0024E21E46|nr:sulfite exporter TauE/SafE family protein [Peribacillus simplex]MDF9759027.1 putative membrane protein YfcA [Peribacillus simplex]MDM5292628.1 sulfite exporter TauE/SafE family protein [Peribacillus simplex]